MLSDAQELVLAAEQEKNRGCTCEPKMEVQRNRGVFAVMVEICHVERCGRLPFTVPIGWKR